MTMPRDFGFGEEALMLRDAARRFFQANMPTDRLHRLVAANPDPAREPGCAWDRDLWQQMAELGWTGLAVPERAGGLDRDLAAGEELCRTAAARGQLWLGEDAQVAVALGEIDDALDGGGDAKIGAEAGYGERHAESGCDGRGTYRSPPLRRSPD